MEQAAAAGRDQVVGEGGLAVVDVGEDADVPDLPGVAGIPHLFFFLLLPSKQRRIAKRGGEGRAPANWEDGAGMGRGGVQAATFGGEVRGDGGGGGGSNWFDSVGAGSSSVA